MRGQSKRKKKPNERKIGANEKGGKANEEEEKMC
jgi:hypothetical protein